MGGVLFIDEAPSPLRGDDQRIRARWLDVLLQVMENDQDGLVVILAGYKDRIDAGSGEQPQGMTWQRLEARAEAG